MSNTCEVCENFRHQSDLSGLAIVRVAYDERTVLLCTGHAKIAQNSGVSDFEGLRDLYGSGRRSFVPRRKPGSLQPTGEARKSGRRATDH